MKYKISKDASGYYYWVFYASNGKAISRSSESYVALADCKHSIELNKASATAPVYGP